MRRIYLLMVAMLMVTFYGCLEKTEISVPVLQVSGSESEYVYFSEVQPATFDVNVRSGEDLVSMNTQVFPQAIVQISDIPEIKSYTHFMDFKQTFSISKMNVGNIFFPQDSIFTIRFEAYTEDTFCVAKRYLKYKFVYPEMDTFDIELGSAPTANCLLDIENKMSYPVSMCASHNFDLVYINELRAKWGDNGFGTCLASPDAPHLKDYFENYKLKDQGFEYAPGPAGFRTTTCGYLDPVKYNWKDMDSRILGLENEWQFPIYINYSEELGLGYGVTNLQKDMMYKFLLHNGRYAMIQVLHRELSNQAISTIKLRIYLQK